MRIQIFAAALSLAALAALPAIAASMAPRFGNTLVGTQTDGTVLRFYYNNDHTFTAKITPKGASRALDVEGTWRVDGENLCIRAKGPDGAMSPERCTLLKGDHVGDTWQTKSTKPDGTVDVQTATIIEGR
jgi:hypothetical protein